MLKPSQLTQENAYVFAQIVDEAGVTKGVFNIVNGRGSVVGHEMAANPKVGMVSLTGSVSAGVQTMEAASANVTKVSLELGGKAPAIVMPDADSVSHYPANLRSMPTVSMPKPNLKQS